MCLWDRGLGGRLREDEAGLMPDMKKGVAFVGRPEVRESLRGEDGYTTFTVRIPNNVAQDLGKIAISKGQSRNRLIGTFLDFAVKNYEF